MSLARQSSLTYLSEQAYLASEKSHAERYEYVDGQIYLMAGSSKRHNRIARNFITQFEAAAHRQGCEVYFSDIKVRVEHYKSYYYPDVVVGCAEDDADEYYLEKPCLIVEVTSDSTARKDYLEKAVAYQTIPCLQAYLMVAQDKPLIDLLLRTAEHGWTLYQFNSLADEILLPCLSMTLTVASVYAGLSFTEQ